MGADSRQDVYESILKTIQRRLEQTIPGATQGTFAELSLASIVNLLFLLRGEHGSIGEYVITQRALRSLIGDELLWSEPKPSPAPVESVQ